MRSKLAGVKSPFISAPASAAKIAARKSESPDQWGDRFMREHAQHSLDKREGKDFDRCRARAAAARLAEGRQERLEAATTRVKAQHKTLLENPNFTLPYDLWLGLAAYHGNADAKLVHRAATEPARSAEYMAKALKLQAEVSNRLEHGFVYEGGYVGGNFNYVRGPFVQKGLISNTHPILALFVQKVPKAGNLMAGADKEYMQSQRSKLLGGDLPYIEDNKGITGVVRIELDMVVTQPEIEELCATAGVPPPNLIVGYENGCGGIVNPHLIWVLHDSVPLVGDKNKKFYGKYRRVLRGLVKAFLPLGADPNGMLNPHRLKNPLSPLWDIRILAEMPYELADIGAAVDTKIRQSDLKAQFSAMHGGAVQVPDHPNVEVAISSNRLFAGLAEWARSRVVDLRAAGWTQAEFSDAVHDEASRLATVIAGGCTDKTEKRAAKVARIVSLWTWTKYKPPADRKEKRTKAEVAAICSVAGRQGAEKKRVRNEGKIVGVALSLAAKLGRKPKQVEVLAEVGIKDPKTIRRHWPAVLAAIEKQGIDPVYVKRNESSLAELESFLPTPDPSNPPDVTPEPSVTVITGSRILHKRNPLPISLQIATAAFGNVPHSPEPIVYWKEPTGPHNAPDGFYSRPTQASEPTKEQSSSVPNIQLTQLTASPRSKIGLRSQRTRQGRPSAAKKPVSAYVDPLDTSSQSATRSEPTNAQCSLNPILKPPHSLNTSPVIATRSTRKPSHGEGESSEKG